MKKRSPGAPTKLTPQLQKTFVKIIRLSGFYADACRAVGIHPDTLAEWRRKGAAGEQPYAGFTEALTKADLDRKQGYLKESQKRGAKKHDAREIQWRAAVTDPETFSIKHHVVVQQQLELATARLKERFSDRPLILEEILSAIAGEHRGTGADADAGGPGAVLPAGGEAAEPDPLQTLTPAIGIPRPGG